MQAGAGRAALAPLGWDEYRDHEMAALGADHLPARVLRADRGGGLVQTADGARSAHGAGLATGDWVAVRDGVVRAVLARRTVLARRAAARVGDRQV